MKSVKLKAPLLISLNSGVLLLRTVLVWYDQCFMVANVSELKLDITVTDITETV